MSEFLEKVNSPQDLKNLTKKELRVYADEVRGYIVDTVRRQGGHLSSNLGAVELTIALHYVFDAPVDKILFDVGHQSYTHKIITGRREAFANLRTDEGVSGFPSSAESEYDAFSAGHSSTSLSAGLGYARARRISGADYNVVSVIGDGAFTGGMAFEALNDLGESGERMIIILNDNKMSISKNVGAFSEYLAKLRLSKRYSAFKSNIKKGVSALPFFGDEFVKFLEKAKDGIKISLLPDKIFENFGVKYFGPVDGHDISGMIGMLRKLKDKRGPVLLHVVTHKGNGVEAVRTRPDIFHGVSPLEHRDEIAFSSVVSDKLCSLAERDERVVAVTAAMAIGTGTKNFAEQFPDRFYDVGIAEEHAVTMCAGLAAAGAKPFFAVYSSFLQRAFDQIVHDVCIDSRPVTLLIDHAGAVENDGVTHQGALDIAFLSLIPNMTILQPKDGAELEKMLDFAMGFTAPLAIRYSKSFAHRCEKDDTQFDMKWETLVKDKSKVYVLAAGNRMLELALSASGVNVINARVLKPLDTAFLDSLPSDAFVVTLEDGIVRGGFGESVRNYYIAQGRAVEVATLGYPDKFPTAMSIENIYREAGLTLENLNAVIKSHKNPRTAK